MPKRKPTTHYFKELYPLLNVRNISQLENKIGTGEGTLRKFMDGVNKELNPDTIQLILKKLPGLNERWVITGEGEIYADYGEAETVQPVNRLDHLYQLAKRGKMHDNDMQEAFVLLLEDLINKKAP